MTPDQLPAGLPMDDKIEAWVQRANDIAAHIAELQARLVMYDTQTLHNAWKEQKAKLEAHLRTTPEGFVLVPVEPTEAMLQAEIDAVSDYWFDHEELGNRTEATKIGYKAMLAASQESGTLRKVIDIAIKEQNKC